MMTPAARTAKPDLPLVGMTLLEGDDRVVVREVHGGGESTVLKSIRLPHSLAERVAQVSHPFGFSGVVRDALSAYLDGEHDDVRHALQVIERALNRAEAA